MKYKVNKIFIFLLIILVLRIVFIKEKQFEFVEEFTGKVVNVEFTENNQRIRVDDKLIYTDFYPEYKYGQIINVKGKVEVPPVFDSFDYKQYLLNKGITSIVFNPEIEVLDYEKDFYSVILSFKDKLRQNIDSSLSKDKAIFLRTLVLGDKSGLTDGLKERLNNSGIRHISAISGMHISILISLLMAGLSFLGKKKSFVITLLFIIFFVVITGFQVSAIRAAIMGILLVLGQVVGRKGDSTRAILIGAFTMLMINPLWIRDVGFQLSFTAVLGINYLAPIIYHYIKLPKFIRQLISISLAAQLFTLPLVLYNFGYVSLISVVTNLLIIPILPFLLVFGILLALFKTIFIFPAWLLLEYVFRIINFLNIPVFKIKMSFLGLILIYALIVYLIYRFRKNNQFRYFDF